MSILKTLGLIAVCTAGLSAGDLRWGAQVFGSVPMDDLKTSLDNSLGYGVGGFVLFDMDNGLAIRPRIDVSRYAGKDYWQNTSYRVNSTISSFSVGADVLYHVSGSRDGLFLLVGLAYVGTRNEISYVAYGPNSVPQGDAKDEVGGLGGVAGVGWQFTDYLGAEVRYSTAKFQKYGEKLNQNAVQIAVSYSF